MRFYEYVLPASVFLWRPKDENHARHACHDHDHACGHGDDDELKHLDQQQDDDDNRELEDKVIAERLATFNTVLEEFEGVHSFHNFCGNGKTAKEKDTRRAGGGNGDAADHSNTNDINRILQPYRKRMVGGQFNRTLYR